MRQKKETKKKQHETQENHIKQDEIKPETQ